MVRIGQTRKWSETDGHDRRAMANPKASDLEERSAGGWQRAAESGKSRSAGWHSVGVADWSCLAGLARSISFASHLPPAFPGMAAGGGLGEDPANGGQGSSGTWASS